MAIPQKELTEKELAPHLAKVQACVLSGVEDYLTNYSSHHHLHSPRSRASLVHDHIVDRIKNAFPSNIVVQRGLTLLFINGFAIRFKKFRGKRMRTSNIPTQQTLQFNNQLELEGLGRKVTHLNAGYLANEFWTDFECYITCPDGAGHHWFIHIPKRTSTTPVISIASEQRGVDSQKRVQPKRKKGRSHDSKA